MPKKRTVSKSRTTGKRRIGGTKSRITKGGGRQKRGAKAPAGTTKKRVRTTATKKKRVSKSALSRTKPKTKLAGASAKTSANPQFPFAGTIGSNFNLLYGRKK